jgi:hypothetical protein
MTDEAQFKMPEPGPEHALLKPMDGTFTAKVTMWMGPGDPTVSTGKMTNSLQLTGLYLRHDYQGDASDGPFPFEGQGYFGYNSTAGEFEGFWIDNASTAMQMETGTVDKSGKVFVMHSEFVMPGVGVTFQKRSVITVTDNDHHTMESFITPPGGDEMKNMVIEYQRV